MNAAPAPSVMTVVLFTDLVDSTAWKRTLGDVAYAAELRRLHDALFRDLLAPFAGAVERDNAGDGFLATFATPGDAVTFALRFHHALATHPWGDCVAKSGRRPATRIGIHLGEVVEFADKAGMKVAGQAVDLAARVMGLAAGGQTLLTRHAFDSARQFVRGHPTGDAPLAWPALGQYRFKGNDEDPLEVFAVGVEGVSPLDPPPDGEKARRVRVDAADDTGSWRPAVGLAIPRRDGWVLEHSLGAGGFGEVWLARHKKTKEARVFKFCFDAERLRSFKRELTFFRLIQAELGDRPDIARLHEVQIDKPPYMLESEYVPDGNLAEWIEKRGGLASWPLADRLRFVAAVARAVAAAHSLGIIHKDLKPSNILIRPDKNGLPHPLLADFGIGVLADRSRLRQGNITEAGFTESVMVGNDSSRTGTRMYSPPEAQLGKAATTGTDVYALGVLLYQIVVGDLRRPLGTGWEEAVPGGDADHAALLTHDIRAATHSDPARRLPTVTALAERLETLDARASGRQKAARARRARNYLTFGGAAVGVVFVGLLLGLYFVNEEREKTEAERQKVAMSLDAADKARAAEAAQRELAEKARDRTREVLDAMTSEVTGDSLATQKVITEEQRKFLREALTYYKEFAGEKADDERSRHRTAAAANKVGLIEYRLGHMEEAATAFRMARDGYAALAADFPAVPAYREELAGNHNNLGSMLADLGRQADAEGEYRKGLAIQEKLAADFPALPVYRRDLAASRFNLGDLFRNLGKRAEAEGEYRRALVIFEKLAAEFSAVEFSAVPAYRQELAMSHDKLGNLLADLGKRAEAEGEYRKSLVIFEKLAIDFPAARAYCSGLATNHNNLGNLLTGLGKRAEAEGEYRKALAIQEILAADFPAVPAYRQELATSHNNLGILLAGLGKRAEAEAEYRKALTFREKLAADFPAVPAYRSDLAGSRFNLGILLEVLGKRAEAEGEYRKALAIQEKLAADFPAVPEYRSDLARSHYRLGLLLMGLGKRAETEGEFHKALAIFEKLAAEFPTVPEYRSGFVSSYYNFACLYAITSSKEVDKKPEYADRAMEMLHKAVKAGYTNAAHMAKDTDLDPLRDRADFKKLLASLPKPKESGPRPLPRELAPPPRAAR